MLSKLFSCVGEGQKSIEGIEVKVTVSSPVKSSYENRTEFLVDLYSRDKRIANKIRTL